MILCDLSLYSSKILKVFPFLLPSHKLILSWLTTLTVFCSRPDILLACRNITNTGIYVTIVVESLSWLQRQKGWVWGFNIGAEMDLLCHVIATRVRSSGFWWASCWSAPHSHVRSVIPFGSHVTFFVKSFSLICRQKGAPGILTRSAPALPPPVMEESLPSYAKSSDTSCIDQRWAENQWGINCLGLRRSWANGFWQKVFPLTLASCPEYVSSCTCVIFLGGCTLTCVRGPS